MKIIGIVEHAFILVIVLLCGTSLWTNMEFDLMSFTLYPADLLQIADFFNILVPREGSKQVAREKLYSELVEIGILPYESVEGLAGDEDILTFSSINPIHPRFDPMLAIKLKDLDLQLKKQDYDAQLLHFRTLDLEADHRFKLRSLELQAKSPSNVNTPVLVPRSRLPAPRSSGYVPVSSVPGQNPPPGLPRIITSSGGEFVTSVDVSKYVTLVPPFRETKVDSYFVAFEQITVILRWPKELWSLLLQCKLVGKA